MHSQNIIGYILTNGAEHCVNTLVATSYVQLLTILININNNRQIRISFHITRFKDNSKFMVVSPLKPPPPFNTPLKCHPAVTRRYFLSPHQGQAVLLLTSVSWEEVCRMKLNIKHNFPKRCENNIWTNTYRVMAAAAGWQKTVMLTCENKSKAGTGYTNSSPSRNQLRKMTPSYKKLHFIMPESSWNHSGMDEKKNIYFYILIYNTFILSQHPDCFMTQMSLTHSCFWTLAGASSASSSSSLCTETRLKRAENNYTQPGIL